MKISKLRHIAEENNIEVYYFTLTKNKSISVMLPTGRYYIALDRDLQTNEERDVCLAHELGHCMTGSFYNVYAKFDIRSKHEYRADKWAIHQLVPAQRLAEAIADGHVQVWDLAEYFGVTEDFMKKAVEHYQSVLEG